MRGCEHTGSPQRDSQYVPSGALCRGLLPFRLCYVGASEAVEQSLFCYRASFKGLGQSVRVAYRGFPSFLGWLGWFYVTCRGGLCLVHTSQ